MFGVQAEHRWLPFKFSKRLGASVFAGIGSVSPNLHLINSCGLLVEALEY